MTKDYVQLLYTKYKKMTLTRKELASEIGISLSKLEKLIAEDMLHIKYKRLGNAQKAPYVFPLIEVASFLAFESTEELAA